MPAYKTDETSIGKRLGRLLQQYQLRIAYAKYKASLYEEEAACASSRGMGYKALQATISKKSWETYAQNLTDKKAELEGVLRSCLIGYSDKQKDIWYSYFIDNLSPSEIESKNPNLSQRTIQRVVAAMKRDMELRFEQKLPRIGERPAPNWNAQDLGHFLEEEPDEGYLAALKDALDYGIIDIDALEFDYEFQRYLETGKRATDGDDED